MARVCPADGSPEHGEKRHTAEAREIAELKAEVDALHAEVKALRIALAHRTIERDQVWRKLEELTNRLEALANGDASAAMGPIQ